MGELIANLRTAYRERMGALGWIDQASKTQALVKLAVFNPRIGLLVNQMDYA
jgi:putative endopeptidase